MCGGKVVFCGVVVGVFVPSFFGKSNRPKIEFAEMGSLTSPIFCAYRIFVGLIYTSWIR